MTNKEYMKVKQGEDLLGSDRLEKIQKDILHITRQIIDTSLTSEDGTWRLDKIAKLTAKATDVTSALGHMREIAEELEIAAGLFEWVFDDNRIVMSTEK